jgi:hypothetical protein
VYFQLMDFEVQGMKVYCFVREVEGQSKDCHVLLAQARDAATIHRCLTDVVSGQASHSCFCETLRVFFIKSFCTPSLSPWIVSHPRELMESPSQSKGAQKMRELRGVTKTANVGLAVARPPENVWMPLIE